MLLPKAALAVAMAAIRMTTSHPFPRPKQSLSEDAEDCSSRESSSEVGSSASSPGSSAASAASSKKTCALRTPHPRQPKSKKGQKQRAQETAASQDKGATVIGPHGLSPSKRTPTEWAPEEWTPSEWLNVRQLCCKVLWHDYKALRDSDMNRETAVYLAAEFCNVYEACIEDCKALGFWCDALQLESFRQHEAWAALEACRALPHFCPEFTDLLRKLTWNQDRWDLLTAARPCGFG